MAQMCLAPKAARRTAKLTRTGRALQSLLPAWSGGLRRYTARGQRQSVCQEQDRFGDGDAHRFPERRQRTSRLADDQPSGRPTGPVGCGRRQCAHR